MSEREREYRAITRAPHFQCVKWTKNQNNTDIYINTYTHTLTHAQSQKKVGSTPLFEQQSAIASALYKAILFKNIEWEKTKHTYRKR